MGLAGSADVGTLMPTPVTADRFNSKIWGMGFERAAAIDSSVA